MTGAADDSAAGSPSPSARRLPAEWEPQAALWLSWPCSSHIWPGKHEAIAETFAKLASVASRFQPVAINADVAYHSAIAALLRQAGARRGQVRLFPHPTDDVWIRDHGPIGVVTAEGLVLTNWEFNAWGGKYPDYERDNAVPKAIAHGRLQPLETPAPGYVLEGGAIETNGCGWLLTTEPVLLNANRNPQWTTADHERMLQAAFGLTRVLWLPVGIPDDDTDGHVDNVARFCAHDHILAIDPQDNPELAANLAVLRQADLTLTLLPQPELRGRAASYANFVVLNDAVLLPVFGLRKTDDRAAAVVTEAFPNREIVRFDTRLLLEEGGGLHCCTWNEFLPS